MLITTYAVGEMSALNGVMGAKAERSCVFHIVGMRLGGGHPRQLLPRNGAGNRHGANGEPAALHPRRGRLRNSWMGKYNSEWAFRTYTNASGVLYHGAQADPDLRYPPYRSKKALRELVAS
jgi:hypothetical protein